MNEGRVRSAFRLLLLFEMLQSEGIFLSYIYYYCDSKSMALSGVCSDIIVITIFKAV